MQEPYKVTGGARIGWTNASWPLAQLTATADALTISSSILGAYTFAPDQVTAVERHVTIPVLAWGIRIHHCNLECPGRIIFWCLGNPNKVLQGIRDSGFRALAETSVMPRRRGIPYRWTAVILAILIWNGLFFLGELGKGNRTQPSLLILAPLIFALGLSVGALKFETIQRVVLKPDRNVGEIRAHLRLVAFLSILLLLVFSVALCCGTLNQND